jgi:Tol biopolymer transport system component
MARSRRSPGEDLPMIGRTIGPYQILAELGRGGMGEVYRARDTRLERDVAVKVLGGALAADADALARFEREAMSIAKLSHPNILAIFEFGREPSTGSGQAGTAFVVTELVDGDTLRTRVEQGPLAPRKAMAYALQIARGMGAAHAAGLVHRDLKPENVMITRADQVKILDFGLAKPIDLGTSDETRAASPVTGAGVVLGTFGYMAPEQVRGQAVDHRADVFAFGAMLYEMLSGRRAFREDTAADTMTAILTKEPPDLDADGVAISPALDRIIRRCIEKSPDLRFQSASDLAFALENLSATSSSASGARVAVEAVVKPGQASRLPWAIATLAVIAMIVTWMLRGPAATTDARWDTFTRITEAAGEETSPNLSPDGSTVVYAARLNGSWGIYSQRVGGRNATVVVDEPDRDEASPAFSPDGARIAFHESDDDGGIFVAGATGESVRRVTDIGFHPAWSPDSTQIAFTTERIDSPFSRSSIATLYVVDVSGGSARPRQVVDDDAVQPSWSPSGDHLVYWTNTGGQRDIYTVAAAGGPRVPVTEDAALDWSPVWSPDGRFIYFSSDRGGDMSLWRIAVDPATGQSQGSPEAVTAGVQASAGLPSFSKDGSRIAFQSRVGSTNPGAIPFDPVTLRAGAPVLLGTQNNSRIPTDVSPDGRYIAYYNVAERQEDVFVGLPDGSMRRVTDDAARDRIPVFTPDSRSLVFYSNREAIWQIWVIGIDGGGLRKITNLDGGALNPVLSPKGDAVVFRSGSVTYRAPFASAGEPPAELQNTKVDGGHFRAYNWSPDGTKLAGLVVRESGRNFGVALYDLDARKVTVLSSDDTNVVRFMADSRRVMYFDKNGTELVVLDTMTRARTVVDVRLPGPASDNGFALSPDNRTIYYGAMRAESDIWIVERR